MTGRISRFGVLFAMMLGTAAVLPAHADSWTEGMPMSTARAQAGAALLNGELYVIGGDGTSAPRSLTEIYDFKGNIWRVGPALPRGSQQFGIAALNDKLYVAGGLVGGINSSHVMSDDVWIFDRKVGVWVEGPKLPAPRAGFGLVAVGGKLYAIGGKGTQVQRIFVFDPKTREWSVHKSSMPAPRRDAAYAVLGGRIYVIGGFEGSSATSRVDVFNPADGSWRAGPSLPNARGGHVAAVVDGRIHVTGGENIDPPRTYPDHFILNGSSWTRGKSLPTSRHAAVAAADGDKLLVIGGSAGAGVFTVFTQTDVVEIWSGN